MSYCLNDFDKCALHGRNPPASKFLLNNPDCPRCLWMLQWFKTSGNFHNNGGSLLQVLPPWHVSTFFDTNSHHNSGWPWFLGFDFGIAQTSLRCWPHIYIYINDCRTTMCRANSYLFSGCCQPFVFTHPWDRKTLNLILSQLYMSNCG